MDATPDENDYVPRRLPVRIPAVTRPHEAEACWEAMSRGGIWEAFCVTNITGPGLLFLKAKRKRIGLHLIRRNEPGHPKNNAIVGAGIMDLATMRREGEAQVYIGITEDARGEGLSVLGMTLMYDAYLLSDIALPRIWAAVHAENHASNGLARSSGATFVEDIIEDAPDGPIPYKIWEMTREKWPASRARLRFPPIEETLALAAPDDANDDASKNE